MSGKNTAEAKHTTLKVRLENGREVLVSFLSVEVNEDRDSMVRTPRTSTYPDVLEAVKRIHKNDSVEMYEGRMEELL